MNNTLATYRLGGGRVVGWWIIGLVSIMAIAGVVTETGRNRVISVGLCLLVIGISYLLGVRPCVMELPSELRVCNPIRTVHIPWAAISDIHVKDVVIVDIADRSIRCFGLPRRERRSAAASINAAINSRLSTAAELEAALPGISGSVVDRLRDHAQTLARGSVEDPQASFTIDRDVYAALLVMGVALVSVVVLIWA